MSMTSIEELAPDHFALVARWLSRPDVNRWLTSDWRNRRVDATLIAITVRNRRNRLFLVRHDGDPCGLVSLADVDSVDRTAMVWYALGEPTHAGHGVSSAAVLQLVHLAFDQMQLQSIYAWIMEDNVASQRVLEKAGFSPAGRIRRATCSGERQVDRVYFDIVAANR
jgi:RimJ/RimL family protein N-acetyltransferase